MATKYKTDTLTGTGRLWRGDDDLGPVDYRLTWNVPVDPDGPGMPNGRGTLVFSSPTGAIDLINDGMDNLQLVLKDGRRVSIVPGAGSSGSNRLSFTTSGSIA